MLRQIVRPRNVFLGAFATSAVYQFYQSRKIPSLPPRSILTLDLEKMGAIEGQTSRVTGKSKVCYIVEMEGALVAKSN